MVLLMVITWSCISSVAYAQDCHTPDPDTTDYKQIPWYGDESNYTVLDRMYVSVRLFRVCGNLVLLVLFPVVRKEFVEFFVVDRLGSV